MRLIKFNNRSTTARSTGVISTPRMNQQAIDNKSKKSLEQGVHIRGKDGF